MSTNGEKDQECIVLELQLPTPPDGALLSRLMELVLNYQLPEITEEQKSSCYVAAVAGVVDWTDRIPEEYHRDIALIFLHGFHVGCSYALKHGWLVGDGT